MKKILTIAAASAVAAFAAPASATTLDFGAFATGNEGAVENGTTINFGGTVVAFSAFNGLSYFDSVSGGRPAGLGVCGNITGTASSGALDAATADLSGSDCSDSADDSIDGDMGLSESVLLTFAEPFDVRMISFRDAEHFVINGDETVMFNAAFDGAAQSLNDMLGNLSQVWTLSDIIALASSGGLDGVTKLWFGFGGDNAAEYYIEAISDVPIPGALPLLISGIAGLGFASRRRKAAK